MTTRTYDYILTVDKPEVLLSGHSILSNTTSTSAHVVHVDYANSNIKVKVANAQQEFVANENARVVTNIVSSDNTTVTYSNTSSLSVNGNSFQINGSTNTFSLPVDALSLSNVTADTFEVFVSGSRLDKSLINFPSSTLGNTGFDINPIPEILTTEENVDLTKVSFRNVIETSSHILIRLAAPIIVQQLPEPADAYGYQVDYNNWISANTSTIEVRVDTGNTESIPFTAQSFAEQIDGPTFQITNVANSNYIRERNAFVQNPLVRLYTIYYPGEWYPANPNGNPTGEGEGRRWPDGFPLRFAEVRGDLNTDVTYNVQFGGINYTPMPINSGGIDIDSSGTINEVTIDISNFDGLITQLCENPDLVGNNTSSSCFASVNGEIVTGIDPRTVPTGSTYLDQEHTDVLSRARSNGLTFNQTVRDSYGVDNASFTIATTEAVDGTWKREKMDSRDLLGGVVEIQSTFANFLDYWPEYSKVRSAYSNVLEMTTTLPYRVGDEVFVRANTFVATIQAIE